jgi:excisionase family DNA binding protein
MPVIDDNLLTVPQAAKKLNCSPATVYRLVESKELSFVKLGRGIRFHPATLARDIEHLTHKSIYQG